MAKKGKDGHQVDDAMAEEEKGDVKEYTKQKGKNEENREDMCNESKVIKNGDMKKDVKDDEGRDEKKKRQGETDQIVDKKDEKGVENRLVGIMVSGLHTSTHQVVVTNFIEMNEPFAKLFTEFCQEVTHVVMIPDENGVNRSLKYFQGIAHRLWVLKYQWLEDSNAAGKILPEMEFQVSEDNAVGDAPESKLAKAMFQPFLGGKKIYLHDFKDQWGNICISKDDITDLIVSCGGVITNSPHESNLVLAAKMDFDDVSSEELKSFMYFIKTYNITVVCLSWFLDCMSTYSEEPTDPYIFNKEPIRGGVEEEIPMEVDHVYADEEREAKPNERRVVEEIPMDADHVDAEEATGECSSPLVNDSDSSFQPSESGSDSGSDTDSVHQESIIEPSDNSEAESDIFPFLNREVKVMSCRRKKHACLFCEKTYTRISRHYTQCHSSEIKVAKILANKAGSKERKVLWMKLVNEGDFKHNYNVLEVKKGEIIPKYRQVATSKQTEQYVPCNFCLGLYGRRELWRHQKKCKASEQDKQHKEHGKGVRNGKLLLPVDKRHTNLHSKILIDMRDDCIKAFIIQDNLLLDFGERLYEKCGHKTHQHQYLSQKLRELARLGTYLKSQSNIKTLEDGMNPKNWSTLIQAVKAVAGYDESSNSFTVPSLPLKLGHSLSKCAKILKTQGITESDDEKKQRALDFLDLYETEWAERLSSKALATLHERKFNEPLLLPLAQDVTLLYTYLEKKVDELRKSSEHYSDFAECILAQIILFNRKRSGEAQRVEMKHVEKGLQKKLTPADKEILETLSTFEQELLKTHTRVEVMGKKGSKVPILFTEDMLKNIEILVKYRKELKIESEYLFIKPNSRFPIRGDSCMCKFSRECGAKNPELLRSTKLRKHLGTMCQVLDLSSEHLELLASFMGHTLDVHKGFYRLPEDTLQTAKLSKVLHLINTGGIAKYKGKTFDDIEFSPEDPIPKDADSDEAESDTEGESEVAEESELDAESEAFKKSNKGAVSLKSSLPCRRPWSTAEEAAVLKHLGEFISSGKLPGKRQCEAAKAAEPQALKERSWTLIKNFIRNRILQRTRRMKAKS